MLRSSFAVVLLLAAAGAHDANAQRRGAGTPNSESDSGSTDFSVIARLGTSSYTSRVPGSCKHEPSGSIYDLPAALWMVQSDSPGSGEIKQFSFTLWRPKNGSADQVSLSIQAGPKTAHIDVNPRGKPVGEASVQLQPIGSGGRFEVRGKDAKGASVNLTVTCPTFSGVEAEGG
jgi:hypothetical protein